MLIVTCLIAWHFALSVKPIIFSGVQTRVKGNWESNAILAASAVLPLWGGPIKKAGHQVRLSLVRHTRDKLPTVITIIIQYRTVTCNSTPYALSINYTHLVLQPIEAKGYNITTNHNLPSIRTETRGVLSLLRAWRSRSWPSTRTLCTGSPHSCLPFAISGSSDSSLDPNAWRNQECTVYNRQGGIQCTTDKGVYSVWQREGVKIVTN